MNQHFQHSDPRSPGLLEIRDIAIDDDIIDQAAATGDEEAAATVHAERFQRANGGNHASALETKADLEKDKEKSEQTLVELEKHKQASISQPAELSHNRDPASAPTLFDWIGVAWMLTLRLGLMAISLFVIAISVRASGVSVDLSSDWFKPFAYASPVLIASLVLSKRADLLADLVAKKALAARYTTAGFVFLVVWIVTAGIMFAMPTSTGLQVSFSTASSTAFDLETFVSSLFPSSWLGVFLLVTHVMADLLISAALGVHISLVMNRGRRMITVVAGDFEECVERIAAEAAELKIVREKIAVLVRFIHEYEAGLKEIASRARLEVKARRITIDAEMAKAKVTALRVIK